MDQNFNKYAAQVTKWIEEYRETIRSYPVKSSVIPGSIISRISELPPYGPEDFENIFEDFIRDILPSITHWQHPKFFSYFPSNTSVPSILGEYLTAALNLQCMSWQTSPGATELEQRTLEWLRDMLGLPTSFQGVIQSGASMATLCAIITARESLTNFASNKEGLYNYANSPLVLYCSNQAHSSITKAARIAGIGDNHIRYILTDNSCRMDTKVLLQTIKKDIEEGFIPTCIVATIGTTSSGAVDSLKEITEIARPYKIWTHVDAAYSGTALLLPEYRHLIEGIEDVDSFVVDPHKWMFTNFDCSAYFVKDKEKLVKTFEIHPEYLKTKEDEYVNNYRDWGIELGRRFRSLKLWFVIKYYGLSGLQKLIRNHIELANYFSKLMAEHPKFEIFYPINLNIICFRLILADRLPLEEINSINKKFLEELNSTGKIYLTHTKINSIFMIRIVIAQTDVQYSDIDETWTLIKSKAEQFISFYNQ
jgi:aromatic-L-amino-acid decarboxylase